MIRGSGLIGFGGNVIKCWKLLCSLHPSAFFVFAVKLHLLSGCKSVIVKTNYFLAEL